MYKPMKMAKKVDGFGLNNDYGGNVKEGVPR